MHFSVILALISSTLAAPAVNAISAVEISSIPGSYIVKLKNHISTPAASDLKSIFFTEPRHEYSMSNFHGFAGTFTTEEMAYLEASDMV